MKHGPGVDQPDFGKMTGSHALFSGDKNIGGNDQFTEDSMNTVPRKI
jgi:hypothetical protein